MRAATRPGWDIEYPSWQGDFPQSVRLRSRNQRTEVDLIAGLSQVEVNVDLPAAAFVIDVPERAAPLTLDELRSGGPLGAR